MVAFISVHECSPEMVLPKPIVYIHIHDCMHCATSPSPWQLLYIPICKYHTQKWIICECERLKYIYIPTYECAYKRNGFCTRLISVQSHVESNVRRQPWTVPRNVFGAAMETHSTIMLTIIEKVADEYCGKFLLLQSGTLLCEWFYHIQQWARTDISCLRDGNELGMTYICLSADDMKKTSGQKSRINYPFPYGFATLVGFICPKFGCAWIKKKNTGNLWFEFYFSRIILFLFNITFVFHCVTYWTCISVANITISLTNIRWMPHSL